MTDLFTEHRGEDMSATKPTTSTMMVGAETAQRWLDTNKRNRPISPVTVAKYMRDMKAGQWVFTADPVRFDIDGNLLDGQHRLTALAACEDVTIPMLIVRGLPSAAQFKMDQGRKRTTDQQLAMKGVANSAAVAASVRLYIAWQEGLLFRDNKHLQLISSPQVESWIEDRPDDVELFGSLLSHIRGCDIAPSVGGAAAFRFMEIDREGCREFFRLLATGAGVEGHPIVALDRRLARIRREGLKASQRDLLAFFVLAWNAWRDNRDMTKFQRPRGGAWTKDNFPTPR